MAMRYTGELVHEVYFVSILAGKLKIMLNHLSIHQGEVSLCNGCHYEAGSGSFPKPETLPIITAGLQGNQCVQRASPESQNHH